MIGDAALLWGSATLCLLVAAGLLWKQAQAKSCPAHQPWAGWLAGVLAGSALIASLVLAALAVFS